MIFFLKYLINVGLVSIIRINFVKKNMIIWSLIFVGINIEIINVGIEVSVN